MSWTTRGGSTTFGTPNNVGDLTMEICRYETKISTTDLKNGCLMTKHRIFMTWWQ